MGAGREIDLKKAAITAILFLFKMFPYNAN